MRAYDFIQVSAISVLPFLRVTTMRVFVLLVPCLALASPAAAQSTNTPLSILDAAIFAHPPTDSVDVRAPGPKTIVLDQHLIGTFSSYDETYSSKMFNLHDVRRYGFNFSTPASGIPVLRSIPQLNEMNLEAHGSRDLGIDKRRHQMYGAGFSIPIVGSGTFAIEGNRYKGAAVDLRGLPSGKSAWAAEATFRWPIK